MKKKLLTPETLRKLAWRQKGAGFPSPRVHDIERRKLRRMSEMSALPVSVVARLAIIHGMGRAELTLKRAGLWHVRGKYPTQTKTLAAVSARQVLGHPVKPQLHEMECRELERLSARSGLPVSVVARIALVEGMDEAQAVIKRTGLWSHHKIKGEKKLSR